MVENSWRRSRSSLTSKWTLLGGGVRWRGGGGEQLEKVKKFSDQLVDTGGGKRTAGEGQEVL